MVIGILILLVLMIMGGFIAFLGDRIGSKVGKKRLTLFGLRPKYTSVVVTIISGILIATFTLGFMAVVNKNVRIALFGLSKLQTQMKELNSEIKVKNQELELGRQQLDIGKQKLADRNREYDEVSQRSAETSRQLDQVQAQRVYMENELSNVQIAYDNAQKGVQKSAQEVKELQSIRDDLNQNIANLNEEKQVLLENVYALREGTVIFRAGQVITSAVVDENMTNDQARTALGNILNQINQILKDRLNVTDPNANFIRITNDDFNQAVNGVTGSKTKKLVRVVAAQNLVRGDMLVINFDIHDDHLIFKKGETIMTADMQKYNNLDNYQWKVIQFLNDVNAYVRTKGILPDPITGKVGSLQGEELLSVIREVQDCGGRCKLTAIANRDVYTEGPLIIDIKVERDTP